MRVCLFVANNCTVDSRVLRQAETFANAGHETRIVAVRRGDVPSVERLSGFEIVRVSTLYTWSDGFPRLVGIPARMFHPGRRPSPFAVEEPVAVADREAGVIGGYQIEPVQEPVELPPRLSASEWIRWLKDGSGTPPRSFRGDPSSRAARYTQIPLVIAFIVRRLAKKAMRVAWWTAKRTRRAIRRRTILATRYRQLDRRMAQVAAEFGADLYWANDVQTMRAAHAAARKTGARVVYDAHEVIWDAPTVKPLQRLLWGRVERSHVKKMDRIFTVCEPIAREMASRYKIERPTVVLNCPRLSETAAAPAREDSPLQAFREPGEYLILFHGSLSPWRGLEQLIRALALLGSEYRLVVLGHGAFREKLEEQVSHEGVGDRVTFLTSVPPRELPAWIVGADIGTIPYQRRGRNHEYSTPNKLFEYMHLGIPIIANELPEIRRIVTEAGFGVICDCSDPAEIAKAISEMMADHDGYRRMRAGALAAAPRYAWEGQESLILSALER